MTKPITITDRFRRGTSLMKQVQDTSPILKDQKSGFIQYSGHEAEFHSGNIHLYQMDCMELLKQTPDKYYELSIVDPPYGIGAGEYETAIGGRQRKNYTDAVKNGYKKYKRNDWDNASPNKIYFNELFRVSKNQIVWGGNYFTNFLNVSRGWIYWDKKNELVLNFSDGELAWTSFDKILLSYRVSSKSETRGGKDRIHPTQKPVALYKWLLHNYAKPGDKILDTHGGSRSLAIACHQMGFDHVSCELDKDYHEASVKRFKEQTAQMQIFQP